jgi:hypothetical protein
MGHKRKCIKELKAQTEKKRKSALPLEIAGLVLGAIGTIGWGLTIAGVVIDKQTEKLLATLNGDCDEEE